jgi:hypothetical protein
VHKKYFWFVLIVSMVNSGNAEELLHPNILKKCLASPKAAALEVLTDTNPYYLRGDFDGDGKPDYALQVRAKNGGNGVLICQGNGALFLLGHGIGGQKFSDMPDDNFLAPYWNVYTKQDIAELKAFQSNVPRPIPSAKGEAIALIWEDGISLIYWNGTKYRWAGSAE